MVHFNRNRKGSRWGYFIEFLIIIAGIMVSFLLNEWRAERRIAEKKITLLKEIQHDLSNDSSKLVKSVHFYRAMLNAHDSLLENRNSTFEKDSLDKYMDYIISYFPFKENKTTFKKILNSQEISLNKKDSLLEEFMVLHNYTYPHYSEWLFIEKDFVLNKLLPYMDLNAPFIYPPPAGRSFDGTVFYELRKKDAFLNYIKSGKIYKNAMLQMSEYALSSVEKLNKSINAKLIAIEIEDKN